MSTLFVCLALLVKALRDMCKNEEDDDDQTSDYQQARKF